MVNIFRISIKPAGPAAALIANGAIHDYRSIAAFLKNYQTIIAVDGGLWHCEAMKIKPDYLIGDLDSVSKELIDKFPDVSIHRFAIDKNETDLFLAIQFAFQQLGLERIGIFGGLEKRTDHALANLHLMRSYPRKVFLETENELLFAIDEINEIDCYPGQTLSLIPLGVPAEGVTTHGLKWEIKNKILDNNFMSISNLCLSSLVKVEIKKGDLICCLSKAQPV